MFKACSTSLSIKILIGFVIFFLLYSSPVFSRENVTLQLKWKHQFQFAGYYAAVEKGFYADEGLTVTIKERSNTPDHIKSVIEGDAEYGVSDSSLILYRLRGEPVVILAAIFQHSPLVLMTKTNDQLLGPFELKGKRVMWQKGIDGAAITAMFHQLGIKLDDIVHIQHNFDDDALIKGNVDAMSAYLSNQPYYYRERGIDVNLINPINYGIDFYGDTLFTSEKEILSNPERVKRFTRASLKGWEYALRNKDEVIQWLTEKYGNKSAAHQLHDEAKATENMIRPDLVEIGHFSSNRFHRIADIYRQIGMAPMDSDIDGLDSKDYLYTSNTTPPWIWWIISIAIIALMAVLVLWGVNRKLNVLVKLRTQEINQARQKLKAHNSILEKTVLIRTSELLKAKDEAELERDKATEANKEKSRFLANMSHELRTPMHAIMSFSDLASKRVIDEKVLRFLGNIKTSSQRLTSLIDNLLDLSKLEAGKMILNASDQDMTNLVSQTVKELHGLSEENSITVQFDQQSSIIGRFDVNLITQVIINLISNAIKYSPQKGIIKIELFTGSKMLKGTEQGVIEVSIKDQGIGVPLAELDTVFDKFVQSSNTETKSGGTGLGLAICKEIIKLHKGIIWVKSPIEDEELNPDKLQFGSEFHFLIPVVQNNSLVSAKDLIK